MTRISPTFSRRTALGLGVAGAAAMTLGAGATAANAQGARDFRELLMGAPNLDDLDIRRDPTPARTIDLPAIAAGT